MESAQKQFEQSVLKGDIEAALLLIEATRFQHTPLDIYDHILIPTQLKVARSSKNGVITIPEEHLALQITTAAMCALRRTPYIGLPIGYSVVVTTLIGDRHAFVARAFSDCLQLDGWSVHYLGIDTPPLDLYQYAVDRSIELLAVSVSKTECIETFSELYRMVEAAPDGPALLVGGPKTLQLSSQFLPTVNFSAIASLREGLTKARHLVGVTNPKKNLERTLAVLGKGLKTLRKQKKLSQQELAAQSGVDRTYLSMLESGKQNPSISVLSKIASVLAISVPELLCGDLLHAEFSQDSNGSHALVNGKRKITY